MAEHLGQQPPRRVSVPAGQGFDAMGKPVPEFRKQAGYDHCKEMGMTDRDQIHATVSGMAGALERDEPYTAMSIGMRCLDLTGTYRLMAVLLTGDEPKVQ